MRRSLPLLLLAGLSLAFAPAPLPRPDPSKEDLKKMQGTWELVEEIREGRFLIPQRSGRAIITGDRLCLTIDKATVGGLVLTLDAKARPKALDLKVGRSANSRGLRLVYSLEGDTLTVGWPSAVGAARPRNLSGKGPGGGALRRTFKRPKPKP